MFHVHLRRMCILLHLDGMSWRYQWNPSHLMCHLRPLFSCYFLLDDLSIDESGVLKSPTIILFPSISPFRLLVFASHIEMLLCWVHIYFSSVAQSCPTLCDSMDCRTPGLPVHHQLPEITQTHVHWVSDAIQPSHPLSSLSPPQHQGLFQWVSSSHQVAIVLELQLQHQSFQWIFRTIFL